MLKSQDFFQHCSYLGGIKYIPYGSCYTETVLQKPYGNHRYYTMRKRYSKRQFILYQSSFNLLA